MVKKKRNGSLNPRWDKSQSFKRAAFLLFIFFFTISFVFFFLSDIKKEEVFILTFRGAGIQVSPLNKRAKPATAYKPTATK